MTFLPKHEATEVHNSKIIKRASSSSMSSFLSVSDFYIIDPASMDFLLDQIYIKRPT